MPKHGDAEVITLPSTGRWIAGTRVQVMPNGKINLGPDPNGVVINNTEEGQPVRIALRWGFNLERIVKQPVEIAMLDLIEDCQSK
jgi:hypothetical protein